MKIQKILFYLGNKIYLYYKDIIFVGFFICLLVVLSNIFLNYLMVRYGNNVTVSNFTSVKTHSASAIPQSLVESNTIKNILLRDVNQYPQITLGVSFIDLNTGNATDVNGSTIFAGASTTKILIACLLLSQIEEGKHSLNDMVDGVTLQTYLQKMINRSDNDAWETLINYIGYRFQRPYANLIGANSYDSANNRIDPNDMAHVLAGLFKGQLLNSQDTQLLLSYMQHTNNEKLIPYSVPADVMVYHKYGSFDGDLHDAAIIDNRKNPFVLAIYTASGSGTLTYQGKIDLFHQITTDVETAVGIHIIN